MPIAFMPSRSVRQAEAGEGRPAQLSGRITAGHRASHQPISNHTVVMIATLVSCALLTGFLIFDLVNAYNFSREQRVLWSQDIMDTNIENSTEAINVDDILKKMDNYNRQRALGATLMVLLILLAISGVCVYVGFRQKVRHLIIGYLVLTFPVMTFAMVYAIIFMVDITSTYVYIKIVTVIVVYTIQANMYRLVYRLYQTLKYEARRSVHHGENNEAYSRESSHQQTPVIIQLKPPPYEKEPPPYSIDVPTIHQQIELPNFLVDGHHQSPTGEASRFSQNHGIRPCLSDNPSMFDLSPESIQPQHNQRFPLTFVGESQNSNTSSQAAVSTMPARNIHSPSSIQLVQHGDYSNDFTTVFNRNSQIRFQNTDRNMSNNTMQSNNPLFSNLDMPQSCACVDAASNGFGVGLNNNAGHRNTIQDVNNFVESSSCNADLGRSEQPPPYCQQEMNIG